MAHNIISIQSHPGVTTPVLVHTAGTDPEVLSSIKIVNASGTNANATVYIDQAGSSTTNNSTAYIPFENMPRTNGNYLENTYQGLDGGAQIYVQTDTANTCTFHLTINDPD